MSWRALASSQDGMIAHSQLLTGGISPSGIKRLAARGELVGVCHTVYRAAAAPMTSRARMWMCVLATDGLLGYSTGGRLWGVYDDHDERVHVILPHSRRVARPPGAVLHRVPVPAWGRSIQSGLPVTSRTWSVLDLVASLRSSEAMKLADRGVQQGWIRADDVHRRLREQPCRTGNRQLRIIGAQLDDGAAATSERVLHRLLRRAGISNWRANHPIWVDGELVGVVDVALPELRIAIEVDGMAYHVDAERFQRDRHRQNDLVALGWTVLRFTWADLTQRPGYVVRVLQRFGSVRSA